MSYAEFLAGKAQQGATGGFKPLWMSPRLFDFQAHLVEWALLRDRAAIFADCGLGKTAMQLVWAENVVRKTNGRVLVLTPLAVGAQTVREGEKFGVECRRSAAGELPAKIVVANYERLHRFTPSDFVGVVCDESSCLKSYDAVTRAAVTEFMRTIPYRLLCTATAAPNDYIELGTSSEALGHLGYMDMLNRFFKNDQHTSDTKRHWRRTGGEKVRWRFKGHAELPFWRWVCSWARAVRRPSDLGFEDAAFVLPPLVEREHLVTAETLADGMLFPLPAAGLHEQREERRRTIKERCQRVAELVADTGHPALVWCHLNDEGDRLADLIGRDGEQISGADSEEAKEEKFLAFIAGQIRVIVTKPKIGAWGLNLQHCAHVVYFPSHSYEAFYQGIRRCWRFGQPRPVKVDVVVTEGDQAVMANLRRKASAADEMFTRLVNEMETASVPAIEDGRREETVPAWL